MSRPINEVVKVDVEFHDAMHVGGLHRPPKLIDGLVHRREVLFVRDAHCALDRESLERGSQRVDFVDVRLGENRNASAAVPLELYQSLALERDKRLANG